MPESSGFTPRLMTSGGIGPRPPCCAIEPWTFAGCSWWRRQPVSRTLRASPPCVVVGVTRCYANRAGARPTPSTHCAQPAPPQVGQEVEGVVQGQARCLGGHGAGYADAVGAAGHFRGACGVCGERVMARTHGGAHQERMLCSGSSKWACSCMQGTPVPHRPLTGWLAAVGPGEAAHTKRTTHQCPLAPAQAAAEGWGSYPGLQWGRCRSGWWCCGRGVWRACVLNGCGARVRAGAHAS